MTGKIHEQYREPSNNKQLLHEVFVMSRIVEVEVRVTSRSRRLRVINLTETSIILDISKTELFYYALNGKKTKSCFCSLTNGKQHKALELGMITLEIMHCSHT